MANLNRNPVFAATLDGLNKVLIDAGSRRDGTGVARCEATLMVLREISAAMGDMDVRPISPKREALSVIHRRAVEKAFFCAIHDQAARGDIDDAAYAEALAHGRAAYRAEFG